MILSILLVVLDVIVKSSCSLPKESSTRNLGTANESLAFEANGNFHLDLLGSKPARPPTK